MSDELVKTGKIGMRPTGFAAKVQQAREQGKTASTLFDCTQYPNRIVLCIDDSGSMAYTMQHAGLEGRSYSRMDMCKRACEEFLNVCDPRDTALGMYTISTNQEYTLSVSYQHLLNKIRDLRDSGGTPTIETLNKIITKEKVTRVVLVSDGESGAVQSDYENAIYNDADGGFTPMKLTDTSKLVLNKYKESKVLIDTVYIGTEGDNGETEMKLIAEYTGGLYFFFKEGESFRTKFKYLAPAFRAMLTSGEIKL
jgi:Mg-chelatase subunit ChlD